MANQNNDSRAKGQGKNFPTLDDKLCFALYSSSLAMLQGYKPLLAEVGLTYPQYLVMLVLWEEDGINVKRLSERLGQDSGALTPLVKRLEAASFLTRRRDTEDERNLSIELTREGRALQAKAEKASDKFATTCNQTHSEYEWLRDKLAELDRTLRAKEG